MVPEMRQLINSKRLKAKKLPTMERKIISGDLSIAFKFLNQFDNANTEEA